MPSAVVKVTFLPLDPHVHAVLVQTDDAVHLGIDPSDPDAAAAAVEALLQEWVSSWEQ